MAAPRLQYDEIELRVEGSLDGYIVRASTVGAEARASFDLPVLDRETIEELVVRGITPRRRRIESSVLEEVTALGSTLFEAVFRGEVRDLYRAAAARADAGGRGLRIKLALTDAPALRGLPWEVLFDEGGFLVLDRTTPVVRSLDLPQIQDAPEVEPPLRVLGVVSSPAGTAALDVAQERRNVEKALHDLIAKGDVELRWLERATLAALVDVLRADSFHILHYIGHGEFRELDDDSVLIMEDEGGFAHEVSSRRLGQILRDHDSLRLAVINACEAGRGAVDDPFAGIAASLLQHGTPAVVAMQFEITDRAAIIFGRDFYDALAHGYPVDAAVAEARKAIWASDNDIEWATPVLFLRARDGQLFDIRRAATPPAPPAPSPPPRPWWKSRRALAGVLAAVLVAAAAAWWFTRGASGWESLPSAPVALEAAAVAALDGRLWVAGGVSAEAGRPKLSRVDVYDPGTREWRPGPELPVALDHASLVSTGRQLFVLGGIAVDGSVDTVYRLDSPTGEWQADVPLPEARGAGAAVWDGTRLVFAGGVGRDGRAADEVWALQDGRWRPLGHLQRAREKLAAATDDYGTTWFMAGRDPNNQAGAFGYVDVAQADSVKPAGRQVTPVQGSAGVWWPGAGACMIGGQTLDGFTGDIDCVSESSDAPSLDPGRAGLGAAVVGQMVYVVGGYRVGVHGTQTVEALRLPDAQDAGG